MGLLSYQNISLPLYSYHPSKLTAMQLWKAYDDWVDPCHKILHLPTTEVVFYTVVDDPSRASTEALALCYAIYYSATVALDGQNMSSRDEWLASLHQYKMGLEQALSSANFLENPSMMLLQSVGIYMVGAIRVCPYQVMLTLCSVCSQGTQLRSRSLDNQRPLHSSCSMHGLTQRRKKAPPQPIRLRNPSSVMVAFPWTRRPGFGRLRFDYVDTWSNG